MEESTRKKALKIQKLIVALCALMAVIPFARLGYGIYHKDPQIIKRGAIGSVLSGSALCLASVAYVLSPDRKKGKD